MAFLGEEGERPASGSRGVLVIPRAAVRRVGDKDVVFVVKEGAVERRAIGLSAAPGNEAVVLSGLAGGVRRRGRLDHRRLVVVVSHLGDEFGEDRSATAEIRPVIARSSDSTGYLGSRAGRPRNVGVPGLLRVAGTGIQAAGFRPECVPEFG